MWVLGFGPLGVRELDQFWFLGVPDDRTLGFGRGFQSCALKVSVGFGSLTVWPIADDDLMVSGKSS